MTTTKVSEKLLELGLTPNQIIVYLELIRLQKCRANALIQATKLHRSIIYTCLDDLVNKGLVSKLMHKGVAMFEVTDPENLVEMMDAKRRVAELAAAELSKVIQEAPRDIRVFEGMDGLMQARERSLSLDEGETLYVMGGSQLSSSPAFESVWVPYHKRRIKKGIKQKIMFDQAVSTEYVSGRNNWPLTKAKYLPFRQDMPAWFEVYGDTFTVGVPMRDPVIFSMRNHEAAKALKNFFDYIWNQNVVVENGREALKSAVSSILKEMQPGEEYYVLGASFGQYNRQEMIDFYGSFHKQRVAKGVVIKMLAYNESVSQIKKIFQKAGDTDFKISHIKALDPAMQNPMQVYLFHGKVIAVTMGQEPTIMRFEQKEVHDNFKTYFDGLWQQESRVLQGPEALKNVWMEAIEAKELKFIGARGYFIDSYPELYAQIQAKAEQTPGVIWKNIVDPAVRGHAITKLKWSKTKYNSTMPISPNVVWIYNNKIAISNWSGKIPIVFISENKQLYQSYNNFFEEMWNRGPF